MNKVLAWLKSNVLIVVFGVFILLLPPAGYIGASMWNSKIKAGAEETLSSRKRNVDSVSSVNYTLPPIAKGEAPVEIKRAPNAAVTEFFRAKRAERQDAIEQVVRDAVERNKTPDRAVLVEGLFPGLADDREERRLAKRFAEAIIGDDEQPTVYAALFESINAGTPPAEADVARRVLDAYQAEIDRAGGDLSALDEDEQEALRERVRSQRLAQYVRRAETLSVYGSPDALRVPGPSGNAVIPAEVPAGPVTATDAFGWQMDYWFVEDLLAAVGLANQDRDGLQTEVPRSPVKRIVSVTLDGLDLPEESDATQAGGQQGGAPGLGGPGMGGMGGMGGRGGMAPGRGPGMGTPGGAGGATPDARHTGRAPGVDKGVSTIRRGTLTLIAQSDLLVRVLEAIERSNFMTVLDVTLGEVDRWADLQGGFYYGESHVVRAEIEVEAAYLHFWLADIATDAVASAWGIERPAEPAPDQPAAP